MHTPPKTLEEAKTTRYGEWSGNPKGRAYDEKKCAYEVFDKYIGCQCSRPNGHGVNGLFCKIHAKKVKP